MAKSIMSRVRAVKAPATEDAEFVKAEGKKGATLARKMRAGQEAAGGIMMTEVLDKPAKKVKAKKAPPAKKAGAKQAIYRFLAGNPKASVEDIVKALAAKEVNAASGTVRAVRRSFLNTMAALREAGMIKK